MPEALCYFCADGIRNCILIVGKEYWAKYPVKKEGMVELWKHDHPFGKFLENNCCQVKVEVSDKLCLILAQPKSNEYLSEPSEVIQIYEKLLKENPFKQK